jgi:hypothetical protein
MAREKEKNNVVETIRFWRGKNPTIVWDGRNSRELCNFSEGHLTTSDPFTIDVLRRIGYEEVALDATAPPEVIEAVQPPGMDDIKPIPAGLTETPAADQHLAEDDTGPAVDPPKPKKVSGKKKPTSKKRSIKRRPSKK